ncbi:MAG: hypothetical protein NDI60_04905 [Elusimicrobiales bacterium]|nr:hypothetical protein [Elusimicrobiales bacterium]
MKRLLCLLLTLLPAVARAQSASVYYFDHDYRISFDLSQVIEDITGSTASIRLSSAATSITYTNGSRFVIDRPEDLTAEELTRTTSYALEAEVELIEGWHSLVLMPQDLLDTLTPVIEEAMSAYFSVERTSAALLSAVSPSGIKFRVLHIPSRTEKRLWEPTLEMRHYAVTEGRNILFTGLSIPLGLNGFSRRMLEEAADKKSAALISLGLGGALTGQVLKAGPERTLGYLRGAGTDIAALDHNDLNNLWQWSRDGSLKISTAGPELLCSNVQVSDPELAKVIKPYVLRKLGGATVAFISFVPSNSASLADLAGSPLSVSDPRDQKAFYTLVNELRGALKAKVVIAVAPMLKKDELGWLLNARGIDAVIGPKTWDNASGRRTRVELRKWDKEVHTGPALTVFPDSSGSGLLRLEFGRRSALTAVEALPAPEDGREPLYYREQLYMKERIVRHFLGSGDTLLPDLRERPAGDGGPAYGVPEFFNLAAGTLRAKFKAEVSVLKVKPFSSSMLGDVPTAMVKTWLGADKPVKLVLAPGRFINELRGSQVPARSPDTYYTPANYGGSDYYAFSGIDDAGRVGGLPINDGELYLTALTADLAEGKPFLRPAQPPAGAPATLHAAVVSALDALRTAAPSRKDWEAAVTRAIKNKPEQRDLWRINLRSLSLETVNTEVTGTSDYAGIDSRLGAINQTRMQGSARLFSEYYSGRFRFDSGISADYGKTVLRPRGQPRLTTESVDQLILESQLVYRMKSYNGLLGPLVVGPYASAAYDTEFSRAEEQPLRKVLRASAGLKLYEGAALQELYAGLTTENIYTYTPARTKYAAEAGLRVYAPLPGTALLLSADANYRNFARSRFDTVYDLKERLEVNLRLSTRLYRDIMLSPFLTYFLATGKKLPGSAANLTVGFALEYSRLFKLKR